MKFSFSPTKESRDLFITREMLDVVPLVFTAVFFMSLIGPLLRDIGRSDTLEIVDIGQPIDIGKPIDLGEIWKEV